MLSWFRYDDIDNDDDDDDDLIFFLVCFLVPSSPPLTLNFPCNLANKSQV